MGRLKADIDTALDKLEKAKGQLEKKTDETTSKYYTNFGKKKTDRK